MTLNDFNDLEETFKVTMTLCKFQYLIVLSMSYMKT